MLRLDPDVQPTYYEFSYFQRACNRRDRQSSKICASCVNFSRKQRSILQKLRRSSRFTLTKCDFKLNLLKFENNQK